MKLLSKICLCCLVFHSYCLYVNENEVVKNNLIDHTEKNSTELIAKFRKCLLKETSAKLGQLQLLRTNEKDSISDKSDNQLTRKIRQNMLGVENLDVNWDKCVLKSELHEHKLLEQEHMVAIKDELEKLKQLIRLLQDQQYLLNMMQSLDDKSKNVDEQEELKRLLILLKGKEGKSFDVSENPSPKKQQPTIKETTILKSENISNIINEFEQLKELIINLQKNQKEEKLKDEIEIQNKALEEIRELIQNFHKSTSTPKPAIAEIIPTTSLKVRQPEEDSEIDAIQEELKNLQIKVSQLMRSKDLSSNSNNETSANILGVSLPGLKLLHPQNRTHKDLLHSELLSRKAKIEDDDMGSLLNALTEEKSTPTNKLQHRLKQLVNKSPKKSSPKIRADNEDVFDDLQRLLDNPDPSLDQDFELNVNEDLEGKISNLQKQLEISSKLKKLEKKINQLHSSESKSLDNLDEHESIKSKIKKIEKQLKKLNDAEEKDLSGEDDIAEQLKELQSDISKLRPKDDDDDFGISQSKDAALELQVALNKLLHGGRKTVVRPSAGHRLHLTPAQIQVLKRKIIAMRQGGSGHSSQKGIPYGNAIYQYGNAPYGHYENPGYNGNIANQGGGYKSRYGPYGATIGNYGSPYGSYNNKDDLALYALLNPQYGSSGQYGGSSGQYGSGSKSYGSPEYGTGSSSSSYGSDANLYGLSKNQYGYTQQSAGPLYGQGSSPNSIYELANLYDKLYGSGGGLYGAANKNYGADSISNTYGSPGAAYGVKSPYGAGTNSYGQYGPISIPSNIGNYLYGSPYGPVGGGYGNTPYAPSGMYLPKHIYGNAYGPGLPPLNSYNSPYGSSNEAYKLDKPTTNGYSPSTGYGKNKKYDSSSSSNQYSSDSSNNQQYSQGQYSSNTAYLDDASKPYQSGSSNQNKGNKYAALNVNSGYSSAYSQSPYAPEPNAYKDGYAAGNTYGSQHSAPYLNVHNIFEHLAYGSENPTQQFFPSYKNGYQSDPGNYQSATSVSAQNPEQPYGYPTQNPTSGNSYAQEKVQDLKTQIYSLQNVINNLNRPEYTQKPEDKETIYKLDTKINDLKNVVGHLSQDGQYSSNSPTTKGYRQSQPEVVDDNSDFQEDSRMAQGVLHTKRNKRDINQISKAEVQERDSQDSRREILEQLSDIISTINFFRQELSTKLYSKPTTNAESINSIVKKNQCKKQIKKRENPDSNGEPKLADSKPSDALGRFLQKLSDIMEVISYLSKSKNDSEENQGHDKSFNETEISGSKARPNRQVLIKENQKEKSNNALYTLVKHIVQLIDKINYLEENVSKNNCTCRSCSLKKVSSVNFKNVSRHSRRKRQLEEEEEPQEEESGENDGARLFLDKVSTFFEDIIDESSNHKENNGIEKQTLRQNQYDMTPQQQQMQTQHQKLQQKLEELKKQLDQKVHINTNHQQSPVYKQNQRSQNNNLYTSSYSNPFSRSSHYQQPSYYPMYYQKPQYYYPQPTYEPSKDKKEKDKFKKKSKKDAIFDKIFDKILDKIIDKTTRSIPKVIRRIFGLEIEKIVNYDQDDYGYGQSGYGYSQNGGYGQNNYAIQKSFKNMGIFGFIPLIILKLVSNLTYFVRQLQKNKFLRTFLVPALVTAGTAGLVIFLVWWLTGDDQYNNYGSYGNSYGNSGYGYGSGGGGAGGSNYRNSYYRSSTIDNDSYNHNSNDNRNRNDNDKRQNGLDSNSEIRGNEIRSTSSNDYYQRRSLGSNYNNKYYRQ